MHEIIVTEGLVLGKRALREADLLVAILTPLGLVRAVARSARVSHSKLRYGLEPLTRARFSFVRGRYDWRLVGVEGVSRELLSAGTEGRRAMARVGSLLLRLVPGVEPSAELFRAAAEGFEAMSRQAPQKSPAFGEINTTPTPPAETFASPEIESIEVVLVLRVLARLGYLPSTEALAPFVDGEFSVELSAKALESRALLVRTINESLRATGL